MDTAYRSDLEIARLRVAELIPPVARCSEERASA